jgi:hypothetical protein
MAVGFPTKVTYANGDVFSASDINDTNGTINLLTSSTLSRAAGKNAIINGGFDIWQRGTSIALAASTTAANGYSADRWDTLTNANQATTISRQVTGDTTNLPNIQYCARYQRNSGQTGTAALYFVQSIETTNSLPMAGQAVTVSFYARRGANYSPTSNALAFFVQTGTGTDQNQPAGYTGAANIVNSSATLTTTWQRFTATGTIGATATEIAVLFGYTPTGTAGTNDYFEVTGVQLELGSYATTFSRAGGTIQGELAACQRYYWRQTTAGGDACATGAFYDSTRFIIVMPLKQTMRVTPTFSSSAGSTFQVIVNAAVKAGSSTSSAESNTQMVRWDIVTSTSATGGQAGYAQAASAGYYDFSAEL